MRAGGSPSGAATDHEAPEYDSGETVNSAGKRVTSNCTGGEVLVIRNEGPEGGPGMTETLAVTMNLSMSGYKRVAMITDGRFSGASDGPCVGHVSPEAADGGPIAAVRDRDMISIDIGARTIHIDLTDVEIGKRLAAIAPPRAPIWRNVST